MTKILTGTREESREVAVLLDMPRANDSKENLYRGRDLCQKRVAFYNWFINRHGDYQRGIRIIGGVRVE